MQNLRIYPKAYTGFGYKKKYYHAPLNDYENKPEVKEEKEKEKNAKINEKKKKDETKAQVMKVQQINAYIRLLNLLSSDYCLLESKLKEKDGEIFRLKNELKGK